MFRPFNFIKDSFLQDVASPTVIYYGFYNPTNTGTGVDTAVAQFKIAKETKSVGGVTTSFKWCGQSYDQIWNNRATLNYD